MNQFPHARWLFFDLGYTLLNEDDAWHDQFIQMRGVLREFGIDRDLKTIHAAFTDAITAFTPYHLSGGIERLTGREDIQKALLKFSGDPELNKPYPDAGRVLQILSYRYRIGLIANQSAGTPQRLAKLGWDRYFSVWISSAEAGVKKPDRAIFQMALDQAKCLPTEAVMIGDRIDNDIRPAKAIKMGAIRVQQGISAGQQPRDSDDVADATVSALKELPALFDCG